MPRTPHRLLAALLAVSVATGVAACGGDDDAKEGDASATTTTAGTGSGTTDDDGGSTSTTTASGSSTSNTTTTVASSGGATSTAPSNGSNGDGVIELSIVGGNVAGGVRREKVALNDEVTLRVTSDVADAIHVHTYDLKVDLVPGRSADLTFLARIPGVFEVELEGRGKKVLELEVGG